nr:hypothetical protein [Tanacetum cinerariifolium]
MFDRAFRRVNTFEDFRPELVKGKEKRVGEVLEQKITKKQKVDDDKEKGRIVGIKSLLDAVEITAAQVYVDTAQLELVRW